MKPFHSREMLFTRWKNRAKIWSTRALSDFVKVVEVGARDGLQNEKKILPSSCKISLINRLSETGLRAIEATSFVSPKWIPQMHDNSEVFRSIEKKFGVDYPVFVPNLKGLERAMNVGVKEIAIFCAASETFSQKNVNCSIKESLGRCLDLVNVGKENNIKIRAYVSCVAGCPYEGDVKPSSIANLTEFLIKIGCYEISLGDTIGVGTPKKITQILNEIKHVSRTGDMSEFAIHCHDTYGQALANIYASLERDIRIFDSSVAGLGGCPYAAGASGNVATEDLTYLLHGQGFTTGIDLNKMIAIGDWISKELERDNQSKVGMAKLSQRRLEKSGN